MSVLTKIWKTIPLGLYDTCAEYRVAMQKYIDLDFRGNPDYVTTIDLDAFEFPIHPRGTTIDLVVVTPRLLFGKRWVDDGMQYGKMFAQARKKGLEPCPHETALALRLAYTDQSTREYLTVAAEDMRLAVNQARLFNVFTDDKGTPYINTGSGWPDSAAMNPESKIVFARPRR